MARWIPDGSSGFTVDGNIVTYKDDVGGDKDHVGGDKADVGADNVSNCLWEDGVSSGKHYWKIRLETLEGEVGVGVTSKDNFKQGNTCKSLQYNSDLTDGSKIFVKEFGPRLEAGDVVGILVTWIDEEVKVYFDINGMNLGKAFIVNDPPFKSIYPMVSFHKSGSATCERVTDLPTVTHRVRSVYSGIQGNWNIKSIEENGTVSYGLMELGMTSLRKLKANVYSWNLLAAGDFDATLSKEDGNWKTSGVTHTQDFCPPELIKIENQIMKLMEEVKVVETDDDETLSIKSDDISTLWTRSYWKPPYHFAMGDPFDPKKYDIGTPILFERSVKPFFFGRNFFHEERTHES